MVTILAKQLHQRRLTSGEPEVLGLPLWITTTGSSRRQGWRQKQEVTRWRGPRLTVRCPSLLPVMDNLVSGRLTQQMTRGDVGLFQRFPHPSRRKVPAHARGVREGTCQLHREQIWSRRSGGKKTTTMAVILEGSHGAT